MKCAFILLYINMYQLTAERMKVAAAYRQSPSRRHRDPAIRQLMSLKEECQEKEIPAFVTEGIDKAMELFSVLFV